MVRKSLNGKQPYAEMLLTAKKLLLFYPVLFFVFSLLQQDNLFAQAAPVTSESETAGIHRKVITLFFEQQAKVRSISQVVLSQDAASIAWSGNGSRGGQEIYRMTLAQPEMLVRISAAPDTTATCHEAEPQWSPDNNEIAFLSDARSPGQMQVYIASAKNGSLIKAQPLTHFDGYVSNLKWSPDGKHLSVLYVEKASRRPSPMAAENRAVGLIDSIVNTNVQRIAVIDRLTGKADVVTPVNFYIFEYDWSPNTKDFVYTAAPPPGDDNWYIAKLYKQPVAVPDSQLLYAPKQQIALPRWSNDGRQIAFIEGLMSDEGGTGGELFVIPAKAGEQPRNLTPDRPSSPSWFVWQPDGNILFTEFVGGSIAANIINPSTKAVQPLWKADVSIRASAEALSLSVAHTKAKPTVAFASSSWNQLPEIYSGSFPNVRQVTHLNPDQKESMPRAENIEWKNEGFQVQGWLLYPSEYDASKKYPLLVSVHGGPAWITTPSWGMPDFNATVYTKLGYFVFLPNPRGSHGQGEAFTMANRRDWGFGDLRDITSGVDVVLKKLPIDSCRVGILGWSYGGSTAMFAITQTNKFKAAVAGAGAGDWLSYYGQNNIDKWMWPYFGASPYDDPAAYAKSSAMTYIKNAKTPTLVLVGERDGEAPSPQSFQFWHALKELHVPTQLMVYPDEGHSFSKVEDRIDVSARAIEWFNKYLTPCK